MKRRKARKPFIATRGTPPERSGLVLTPERIAALHFKLDELIRIGRYTDHIPLPHLIDVIELSYKFRPAGVVAGPVLVRSKP
jgi:hypothetical protein